MRFRWPTWVLAACTIAVLIAALPGAVRDGLGRGDLYLFSQAFLDDLPRRLSGPGRMRFIFQPLVAITLGVLAGRRDALRSGTVSRRQFLAESAGDVANLFFASILLDVVAQWLILGVAHPAAALVVGPVLITLPYVAARRLTNRLILSRGQHHGQDRR